MNNIRCSCNVCDGEALRSELLATKMLIPFLKSPPNTIHRITGTVAVGLGRKVHKISTFALQPTCNFLGKGPNFLDDVPSSFRQKLATGLILKMSKEIPRFPDCYSDLLNSVFIFSETIKLGLVQFVSNTDFFGLKSISPMLLLP